MSEILLSEVQKASYSYRWDSTYFLKEFLFDKIQSSGWLSLSDVCKIKSGTTPKDRNENLKEGVVLLKTNDIRNNVLLDNNNDYFYIDELCNKKMITSQLQANDVLINIVGATTDVVGRVAFVPSNFPKANITQAMSYLRIIDNRINPFALFVFLQSKYGVNQTRRIARPTGQYNINNEELGSYKVPLLSNIFQIQIEQMVKSVYTKLEESKQLYTEAENMLLEELGLKNWQPKNENINIKSVSESFLNSGRLDAEYYQSKYDEIDGKIKRYKGGFDVIGNLFLQNTDVCDYVENSYNYIEIGDINIGDGSASFNLIATRDLPDNAKRVIHVGDLLISKVRPYRGAVSIIDFEAENLIASGAFTVLHEKSNYKKEVLQVLLRTQIYKEWVLKWNVGTSYPVIKDEDILNLPIPLLPIEIQTEISAKIQRSFALKKESKSLLEQAKTMVENEIEKGDK